MVIDVAGEASILMNIQEMSTAVQYRLPVKVFILNNEHLGMVRQLQDVAYGGRYPSVKSILERGLDKVPVSKAPEREPILHDNIRDSPISPLRGTTTLSKRLRNVALSASPK
jgi:hypothetical protein